MELEEFAFGGGDTGGMFFCFGGNAWDLADLCFSVKIFIVYRHVNVRVDLLFEGYV